MIAGIHPRLLTVVLLACSWEADPDVFSAAPGGAPPPPAPALAHSPPPAPPGPPHDGTRIPGVNARFDVQVVALAADRVRVVGPEGEASLPLAPGALGGASPQPGDVVSLDARIDAAGRPEVLGGRIHTGLPIAYGEVTEVTEAEVALASPLGAQLYRVNRWSDLPEGLAPGDWASVKHYASDAGREILNVRRYAGAVEERGVVTAVHAAALEVHTLAGERRYPLVAPAGLRVGSLVVVRATRGEDGAPEHPVASALTGPLLLVGKLHAWDPSTRTLHVVDAWGNLLGTVAFHLPGPLPADLVPGDLVDVTYRFDGGRPTVVDLAERPISPVYFGRLERLDEQTVAVRTLQGVLREVRRTPTTWFPRPVAVGDKADVIYAPGVGGGLPTAEVVVKE